MMHRKKQGKKSLKKQAMKRIKFRMVAYTGAAGKYDASAPMCGNEDNFYVDDNLSDDIVCHCDQDAVIELTDCGLIMAVADGMGGMNAGEIASEIAVNTVRDYFAPGKIDKDMAASAERRKQYLEDLVVEADKRIKEDAGNNPEHEGMGSTIILAWIVGNQLTLTWCGDSRAYRFNPKIGLVPLSEDHSYVQDLVKEGVLSYEDTFAHPHGNIITRSLGEPDRKAQPETRQYSLYTSDIILLCSDGLSGVLRDKKTKDHEGNYYPGENIEDIIRANSTSMKECKDALWDAAEKADWYDNITIILCEMLDGLPEINPKEFGNVKNNDVQDGLKEEQKGFWSKSLHVRITPKLWLSSIIIFLLIAAGVWYYFAKYNHGNVNIDNPNANTAMASPMNALSDTTGNALVTNGDSTAVNKPDSSSVQNSIGSSALGIEHKLVQRDSSIGNAAESKKPEEVADATEPTVIENAGELTEIKDSIGLTEIKNSTDSTAKK